MAHVLVSLVQCFSFLFFFLNKHSWKNVFTFAWIKAGLCGRDAGLKAGWRKRKLPETHPQILLASEAFLSQVRILAGAILQMNPNKHVRFSLLLHSFPSRLLWKFVYAHTEKQTTVSSQYGLCDPVRNLLSYSFILLSGLIWHFKDDLDSKIVNILSGMAESGKWCQLLLED